MMIDRKVYDDLAATFGRRPSGAEGLTPAIQRQKFWGRDVLAAIRSGVRTVWRPMLWRQCILAPKTFDTETVLIGVLWTSRYILYIFFV